MSDTDTTYRLGYFCCMLHTYTIRLYKITQPLHCLATLAGKQASTSCWPSASKQGAARTACMAGPAWLQPGRPGGASPPPSLYMRALLAHDCYCCYFGLQITIEFCKGLISKKKVYVGGVPVWYNYSSFRPLCTVIFNL